MAHAVPAPLTHLSEEESLFYSTVRQFADETIAPLVRTMDEEQQFAAKSSVLELLRAADSNDATLIDQSSAMTELSLVHIMRRDQHADAIGGERVYEIPELPPRRWLDA